jgi:hypothetical protein
MCSARRRSRNWLIERRIAESASGAVSGKTFEEIIEEELGAGGEA